MVSSDFQDEKISQSGHKIPVMQIGKSVGIRPDPSYVKVHWQVIENEELTVELIRLEPRSGEQDDECIGDDSGRLQILCGKASVAGFDLFSACKTGIVVCDVLSVSQQSVGKIALELQPRGTKDDKNGTVGRDLLNVGVKRVVHSFAKEAQYVCRVFWNKIDFGELPVPQESNAARASGQHLEVDRAAQAPATQLLVISVGRIVMPEKHFKARCKDLAKLATAERNRAATKQSAFVRFHHGAETVDVERQLLPSTAYDLRGPKNPANQREDAVVVFEMMRKNDAAGSGTSSKSAGHFGDHSQHEKENDTARMQWRLELLNADQTRVLACKTLEVEQRGKIRSQGHNNNWERIDEMSFRLKKCKSPSCGKVGHTSAAVRKHTGAIVRLQKSILERYLNNLGHAQSKTELSKAELETIFETVKTNVPDQNWRILDEVALASEFTLPFLLVLWQQALREICFEVMQKQPNSTKHEQLNILIGAGAELGVWQHFHEIPFDAHCPISILRYGQRLTPGNRQPWELINLGKNGYPENHKRLNSQTKDKPEWWHSQKQAALRTISEVVCKKLDNAACKMCDKHCEDMSADPYPKMRWDLSPCAQADSPMSIERYVCVRNFSPFFV